MGPSDTGLRILKTPFFNDPPQQLTLQFTAVVGRDYFVAITGDHGMPTNPPATGGRDFAPDIIRALHAKFDPGAQLIPYYEPENSQIFVDQDRLVALGLSLKDVAAFLEAQPYIFAAFTEDEVRREAARLR